MNRRKHKDKHMSKSASVDRDETVMSDQSPIAYWLSMSIQCFMLMGIQQMRLEKLTHPSSTTDFISM
ncbi:uncharacterized protein N7483_004560 [Penicillium malachiteum]|uniref:uncharacterized protein n=1 Tax=Penicillium malachiteum TaxID=1324776 RepID=UPI0025466C04|nr:uncharacterized protein N7483_004560 [Penicillium malachiteum]KAJ5730052.1 hypothetical protein N7483_004560 [Penicillium malachiteum]